MTSADGPPLARRGRRSPTPTQRQRDPERTRKRILTVATAEFAAKGYAGARVSEIADRAGVNKQLISYYFGGKAGLYRTIVSDWTESDADRVLDATPLAELAASYVPTTPRHREVTRLLAWEGLTADSGDPGAESRGTRMRQALEDLRRRQTEGELAGDLDPRCFLLAFMAAAAAPATLPQLASSIFGADPTREEFLAHYADQLARMVSSLAQPPAPPRAPH
ncbi:MAG: TetR/AcrR family transcriptional regulator [Egibacteraceae bacterium]